jgi:4-amino-4-deoxy-L-arabinose transferase-like glycosyltransferase
MKTSDLPLVSPYNSPKTLWTIAISFVLIALYMLGARTLVPTDEGRYAEMGREMFATGDWITQRLNGIKYFEKPPLQNWMNALSFAAFGLGEWQARLWTGFCGLLGVVAVGYTGWKVFGRRVAISAALVLGSSFWWVGFSQINSLDMGLSGMMTLALCGLLLGQRDDASETERRNAMLLCWAGMALATMSKGLIGFVLPGAVLVIYTFVARDWSIWTRLHMGKGLVLFFAITAPWFILVWLKNPEHPHFFFIHEHFQRFTTKIHHRTGPWYYFIPLMIIGICPWLALLAQSLWSGLRRTQATRFQAPIMLSIWAIFIFFFFSISGSKLPSYIVPIFPATALLIALYLESKPRKALIACAIILVVIGVAALSLGHRIGEFSSDAFAKPLYEASIPWIYAAAILMILGGGVAIWFAQRQQDIAVIALAVAGLIGAQSLFLGVNTWGKYNAGIHYVDAINAELPPDAPIYAVGRYEQSLPFYLQRTLILVEHADEMSFGLSIEPHLWIPNRNDFVVKWKERVAQQQPGIMIMNPQVYADFVAQGVPMRVLSQDPKRVIASSLLVSPAKK